jgi:hypothetical protein
MAKWIEIQKIETPPQSIMAVSGLLVSSKFTGLERERLPQSIPYFLFGQCPFAHRA